MNNHTFVTDIGGDLDQYVGRADLPNGELTFSIGINAPVLHLRPDQINPDGTVAAVSFYDLVDQHILPEYAQLTLQVYDVDDNTALGCPEVDHIYISTDAKLMILNGCYQQVCQVAMIHGIHGQSHFPPICSNTPMPPV